MSSGENRVQNSSIKSSASSGESRWAQNQYMNSISEPESPSFSRYMAPESQHTPQHRRAYYCYDNYCGSIIPNMAQYQSEYMRFAASPGPYRTPLMDQYHGYGYYPAYIHPNLYEQQNCKQTVTSDHCYFSCMPYAVPTYQQHRIAECSRWTQPQMPSYYPPHPVLTISARRDLMQEFNRNNYEYIHQQSSSQTNQNHTTTPQTVSQQSATNISECSPKGIQSDERSEELPTKELEKKKFGFLTIPRKYKRSNELPTSIYQPPEQTAIVVRKRKSQQTCVPENLSSKRLCITSTESATSTASKKQVKVTKKTKNYQKTTKKSAGSRKNAKGKLINMKRNAQRRAGSQRNSEAATWNELNSLEEDPQLIISQVFSDSEFDQLIEALNPSEASSITNISDEYLTEEELHCVRYMEDFLKDALPADIL